MDIHDIVIEHWYDNLKYAIHARKSIKIGDVWSNLSKIDIEGHSCEYCKRYKECEYCPVSKFTKTVQCINTPWRHIRWRLEHVSTKPQKSDLVRSIIKEIRFLKKVIKKAREEKLN
jgi:hypothetical protein